MTGKGGVGKTTLTALLSHLFAAKQYQVLSVDEDPQQNLAFSLGYPMERAGEIVPVSKNLDYVEEKIGARPGEGWGAMLTLNPDVSDVVERFGMHIDSRINLLVIGSVIQAATGCLCPENALLDAIVGYIKLREDEIILMDTQAGVEHFGRALAEGFRNAVILTEPSFNAVQVALHSAGLAYQLGISRIHLVVNKVREEHEREKVLRFIDGRDYFQSIHYLPFDEEVYRNEPDVSPLLSGGSPYVLAVRELFEKLIARDNEGEFNE
ncbi:MAG: AAA family ATPase [Thermodesulfobacteriota bacterium]|nr:AAA family ATPase [Thermodesulfobacteriota bacterium]